MKLATCAVSLGILLGSMGLANVQGAATSQPASRSAEITDLMAQARNFFQGGQYAEALQLVNRVLKINPALQDAKLLQGVLIKRLTQNASASNALDAAAVAAAAEAVQGAQLSEEAINRIRLIEYSDAELKTGEVRGSIPRAALDEFWNKYLVNELAGASKERIVNEHNAFVQPGNFARQVALIRQYRATEFYSQIKLASEPASMIRFRTLVQPFLLQNCATAGCHNAAYPGVTGLRFFGPVAGSPPAARETYSNFYMLTQAKGPGGSPLLDRERPGESALLQMCLANASSQSLHPGQITPRVKFSGPEDPRFLEMTAWIKSLSYPTPNYGIEK